jgi:hypothetical protein
MYHFLIGNTNIYLQNKVDLLYYDFKDSFKICSREQWTNIDLHKWSCWFFYKNRPHKWSCWFFFLQTNEIKSCNVNIICYPSAYQIITNYLYAIYPSETPSAKRRRSLILNEFNKLLFKLEDRLDSKSRTQSAIPKPTNLLRFVKDGMVTL